MTEKLMVIVPDRLSDLLAKGELIDRYYNPGNLFSEVHIVMTNDDRPDTLQLQKLVGNADLHLHNLPAGRWLFAGTLGWRPWLLGAWVKRAIDLAKKVRPGLIRCHGARLNAYIAYSIKRALGVPYVVSLHINPDEDVRGRANGWLRRLATHAMEDIERIALCHADRVLPVYRPIVPYLERLAVTRYEVCYNVLNPSLLRRKDDYALHRPVRIVSVGRQFAEKNPDNLIRAVASMHGVELTLYGDGQLHDYLRQVAEASGAGDRIHFQKAIANDELCQRLPDYDIFAVHTEYWELSKSVLEALLTGLPLVINRRQGEPVPELSPDICVLVENSVEAYREALQELIRDDARREALGRAAYAHAQTAWAPEKTEAKYVEVYRQVLGAAA